MKLPTVKNNSFKVRLPSLLQLPRENWKASLWGLQVSDEGHGSQIISSKADTELVGYRIRLHNVIKRVMEHGTLNGKAKIQ